MIDMESVQLKRCRAIVMFGPATEMSGLRPAEYYQVTIDASKQSPSGQYIRFGLTEMDELIGWQRIAALTVCEILEDNLPSESDGTVVFMKVV